MPILRLPKNDDPLTQGDILSGLRLYATGNDWNVGGSPEELDQYNLSLVFSRPCAVLHKPRIVVAAGRVQYEDGNLDVESGNGRFIARTL